MRLLYHPLTLLAFTLLSIIFALSLYSSRQKMRTSTEQISVLEQEVDQMASQVSDLELEVQDATSSTAQEKIIRDELLRQKPDEIIVQLPAIEEVKITLPSPSPAPTPWEEWKQLLFFRKN